MEKSALDMFHQLKRSKDPVPTVELDFHSLPDDQIYGDVVIKAARKLAEGNERLTATIYTHERGSVNFMEQTWSVFFAICGNYQKDVLEAFVHAFKATGARARISDHAIVDSSWMILVHIEDGVVWGQHDPATWTDQI